MSAEQDRNDSLNLPALECARIVDRIARTDKRQRIQRISAIQIEIREAMFAAGADCRRKRRTPTTSPNPGEKDERDHHRVRPGRGRAAHALR